MMLIRVMKELFTGSVNREVEKIDLKDNLIRLIEQYQNLVFSICLKMTGDYFTAEDITQDTFLSAFRHYKSFDGTNEKTWICRIATNKCIDYKRAAARNDIALDEEALAEMPGKENEEPLNEIINEGVMNDFKRTVGNLEEPYRSVAVRHFIDGKTAREISEESEIGLKTIQTRILRAKNMLKQKIRKEDLIT